MKKIRKTITKEEVEKLYDSYIKGEISSFTNPGICGYFKKYGFKMRTIQETRTLRASNIYYSRNKYKYTYLFETVSTPFEAYILGLFLTDGWITSDLKRAGLRLISSDVEHLDLIKNYICPDIKTQVDKNSSGFEISSMFVVKNLISLGITVHKSQKGFNLPELSDELFMYLYAGMISGDGSIFRDAGALRVVLASTDKISLEAIQNRLLSLNIETSIVTEIRKNKTLKLPQGAFSNNCMDMHRLLIRKKKSITQLKNLLINESFMLQRKWKKLYE